MRRAPTRLTSMRLLWISALVMGCGQDSPGDRPDGVTGTGTFMDTGTPPPPGTETLGPSRLEVVGVLPQLLGDDALVALREDGHWIELRQGTYQGWDATSDWVVFEGPHPDEPSERAVLMLDRSDGVTVVPVLGESVAALDLSLSPDGRHVAVLGGATGRTLWIAHRDGSPPEGPFEVGSGASLGEWRSTSDAFWAHDGNVVLVGTDGVVHVVDGYVPEGGGWQPGGTELLISTDTGVGRYDFDTDTMLWERPGEQASWSPDGAWVHWSTPGASLDMTLNVADAAGTQEAVVGDFYGLNAFAAWSADGRLIAGDQGGEPAWLIEPPDATTSLSLAEASGSWASGAWSDGGSWYHVTAWDDPLDRKSYVTQDGMLHAMDADTALGGTWLGAEHLVVIWQASLDVYPVPGAPSSTPEIDAVAQMVEHFSTELEAMGCEGQTLVEMALAQVQPVRAVARYQTSGCVFDVAVCTEPASTDGACVGSEASGTWDVLHPEDDWLLHYSLW